MVSRRDFLLVILQFLEEENFKETAHTLEQESGVFFNMTYFESLFMNGDWDGVEKYLSGFSKAHSNTLPVEFFYQHRRQKFLEALDRKDRAKAADILANELRGFNLGEDVFKEMTELLHFDNIRESKSLADYGDTMSERVRTFTFVKNHIEPNPFFVGKLQFPEMNKSRLRTLIDQSLTWQHKLCENPRPITLTDIKTIIVDHDCGLPSAVTNPLMNASVPTPVVYFELPRVVVMELPQGSAVNSMDFHPIKPNVLLVGTNTGDVMVWDLVTRTAVSVKFKVWVRCSVPLQDVSINRVKWSPEGTLFGVAYSMHLVHLFSYTDSSDFSELRNPLEIEAHAGSVNDLAFSYPFRQPCVVTCGEDRMIQVWDATSGTKQYTFQGHEAPVCCVCTSQKGRPQFIYSIATDGKIKRWQYYNYEDLTVHYSAIFPPSTTMAFSTDGTRLFSCGADWKGESFLIERDVFDYTVRRRYKHLHDFTSEVAQFDTTLNRFLVAGHDKLVKYWDMDNNFSLLVIRAGGGLMDSPCVRFNNDGTLLAVSTINNSVKVLAKCPCVKIAASGCRCFCSFEKGSDCDCICADNVTMNAVNQGAAESELFVVYP